MSTFQENYKAIELALQINKFGENKGEVYPVSKGLNILNSYSGFGKFKAILYPLDKDWRKLNVSKEDLKLKEDIVKLYKLIEYYLPENYNEAWESLKNSVLTSFYTPKEVPDLIFRELKSNNEKDSNSIKSFLDPSAGNGVYIDAFLKYFPNANIEAVELDFITSLILKAKYAKYDNIKIHNKGFEKVNFKKRKFDVIASNIPFGDVQINNPNYPKEVTSKIHNFYFNHSYSLLNEGGFISFITSTGVFNNKSNNYTRSFISKNSSDFSLNVLPENLFKDAGTKITSHLFNGVKGTLVENKDRFNELLEEVVTTDEGVTRNSYINSYEDFCFISKPTLGTNPYGNKEFNYNLPLEIVIESLKDMMITPSLNIIDFDNEEDKILKFYNYPNDYKINTIQYDHFSRKDFILNENYKDNQLIGAFVGNYLGKKVPLFVVSKKTYRNEFGKYDYLIESFLKNHNFSSPILGKHISGKVFNENINSFLTEVTNLAKVYNIEIDLDFRNDIDGLNFSKYMLERFEKPNIKIKYVTPNEDFFKIFGHPRENDLYLLKEDNTTSIFKIDSTIYDKENVHNSLKLEKIEGLSSNLTKRISSALSVYYKMKELHFLLDHSQKDYDRIQKLTRELNLLYDNYIGDFGFFNEKKMPSLLDNYSAFLLALENKIEIETSVDLFNTKQAGFTYEKADIFNLNKIIENDTEKEISVKDAIISSIVTLNFVDLKHLEKRTGKSWPDIEVEASEYIIYDPLSENYKVYEEFLQGNLYEKLDALESLDKNGIENKQKLDKAIQVTSENIPLKIPYDQINKQFSSRWIPIKYLSKFVDYYYDSKFIVNYNKKTDNIIVQAKSKGSRYSSEQMLNGRYIYPENIIEDAFYDKYPIKTHKGKVDVKSTNYYRKQIDLIKKAYVDYLQKSLSQDEKVELERFYNRLFNGAASIDYSKALIDLKDANLSSMNIEEIYPHQKEAVWKTLIKKGGLVDHEVGFGKTLTMIISSYYMKKLGIVKKPVLTGIKANIEEIGVTYQKIFPNAKVLYATAKDYQKSNRDVFFNKIKNNDWDIIVMSHDQLTQIPSNPDVEKDILNDKLQNLEQNMLEIYDPSDLGKKQYNSLQRAKNNLETKIEASNHYRKILESKNTYTFDKLGIDHIIIDESHIFKNLGLETRHERVSGLGNIRGSKRAETLLYHIRSIQLKNNSDMGASFYSGTPISNSLTELYNIQYYLTPRELEFKGIKNFDSWASLFAKKSVDFETNIVGQVIQKERFRSYINLPELSKQYTDIAHVMNGENPYVDRPDKNEYTILTEQTPLQKKFNVKLLKFLSYEDESMLGLEKPLNIKDDKALETSKSLIVTNLAQKASMDMRLIHSRYKDDPNSKVNAVIENVLDNYIKFNDQKGTQIIFADQSVSKQKMSYNELEENYNSQIFTSLYDDIKFKLIAQGVKEEEIAFIQDYKTDKKKAELSIKMNKGDIRVLLGTTQGAGTGLNVQQKLSNIIHLTIPWKPSGLDQRNGRGYRKGNILAKKHNSNKIDIGYAVTRNTLDNYRIDLNKTKKGFIDQIKNATNSNRTIDEGELDENNGMNLAELQALLSGDNTLLEKSKLDKKYKEIFSEKEYVEQSNFKNQYKYSQIERRVKNLIEITTKQKKDIELFDKNVSYNKQGIKVNNPIYYDYNSKNQTVGEFLQDKAASVKKGENNIPVKIGELYGFGLYMKYSIAYGLNAYAMNEDTKVVHESFNGTLNFNDLKKVERYYSSCFNGIKRRLEYNLKELKKKQKDLEEIKPLLNKKFDKEEDLLDLEKRIETITEKLQTNKKTNEIVFDRLSLQIEDSLTEVMVVNNVKNLEYGLLWDTFENGNKSSVLFTDDMNMEILKELSNEYPKLIDVFKIEYKNNMNLVHFEIKDADHLYDAFIKSKESIINKLDNIKNKGLKL